MEERDLMFDAHNNQGWMSVLQESVYVAINLTIKMFQDGFQGDRDHAPAPREARIGTRQDEAGGLGARVFRKSRGLTGLIRAFEDARVIQFQGQNVELEVFARKRQQRAKLEALTNGGDGLADEISRAE